MFKRLTDVDLTWVCPSSGTEVTVTVASLVAGTGDAVVEANQEISVGSPNAIDIGVCPTDGTIGRAMRTYHSPRIQAGMINSLHEELINLAQTNPLWTTYYTTEVKPAYIPTFPTVDPETRIDTPLTVDGRYDGYDLDQVVALLGATQAEARIRAGLIFTNASNAEITAFVNSVIINPAEQTLYFNRMIAQRLSLYGF